MKKPKMEIKVKGRYLGITLLVVIQIIFGIIHIFFGLAMLSGNFSIEAYSISPIVYSLYIDLRVLNILFCLFRLDG